jgi:hypothetical protein
MTTTQETEMKKFSEQIKQDFIKALTVEREMRQQEIEKFQKEKLAHLESLKKEQKKEKMRLDEIVSWEK